MDSTETEISKEIDNENEVGSAEVSGVGTSTQIGKEARDE